MAASVGEPVVVSSAAPTTSPLTVSASPSPETTSEITTAPGGNPTVLYGVISPLETAPLTTVPLLDSKPATLPPPQQLLQLLQPLLTTGADEYSIGAE